LKGSLDSDYPIRFVKGGRALLTAQANASDVVLTIVDLASGRRESWKRISDDMVRPPNQLFVATPDLKYYAYQFPRYSSVLYLVENCIEPAALKTFVASRADRALPACIYSAYRLFRERAAIRCPGVELSAASK
jgi:hypothetical protein